MNISELLQQTQYVNNRSYGPKNTFQQKKFGEIYLYNKTVKAKTGVSVIEVSMMIKAATEKNVSSHKVMLAISGVNQVTVQAKTLVGKIRALDKKFEDEEAYSDEDLIIYALEGKPFKDQTVLKNEAGTYTIIDDNISKDNDVMVWCSCSNYYWVWQYYNVENNVDIFREAPARYVPRTEAGRNALKENKPMRNPGRHPGMCKHILLLLALLMDTDSSMNKGSTNILKEARSITRSFKANIGRFQKVNRMTEEQYKKIIKTWEVNREEVNKTRGVDSDPVLAPKKQQKGMKNWQKIQNNMVGGKRRKR